MFENFKKLFEWLPTLPIEAKIPITLAIISLAVFFIVMLWLPCPSEVSAQKIEAMLREIDDIEQNWESQWQEVEPLAKRAKSYIRKCFPEQESKINDALACTNVSDVAKVLKAQLQIVNDHLKK